MTTESYMHICAKCGKKWSEDYEQKNFELCGEYNDKTDFLNEHVVILGRALAKAQAAFYECIEDDSDYDGAYFAHRFTGWTLSSDEWKALQKMTLDNRGMTGNDMNADDDENRR